MPPIDQIEERMRKVEGSQAAIEYQSTKIESNMTRCISDIQHLIRFNSSEPPVGCKCSSCNTIANLTLLSASATRLAASTSFRQHPPSLNESIVQLSPGEPTYITPMSVTPASEAFSRIEPS